MKKTLILAGVAASFASAAYAQSSVTLYGVVDAGFTYVNNEANANGGHKSAYALTSGNVDDSRWCVARKIWAVVWQRSTRSKAVSTWPTAAPMKAAAASTARRLQASPARTAR